MSRQRRIRTNGALPGGSTTRKVGQGGRWARAPAPRRHTKGGTQTPRDSALSTCQSGAAPSPPSRPWSLCRARGYSGQRTDLSLEPVVELESMSPVHRRQADDPWPHVVATPLLWGVRGPGTCPSEPDFSPDKHAGDLAAAVERTVTAGCLHDCGGLDHARSSSSISIMLQSNVGIPVLRCTSTRSPKLSSIKIASSRSMKSAFEPRRGR